MSPVLIQHRKYKVVLCDIGYFVLVSDPLILLRLAKPISPSCSVTATNAARASPAASSLPVTPEYIPVGLPTWLLYEATKPALL
jgi:hypothetical protein